ncbi:hypothetical protein [Calycomorphotria hydatis]|uniref:Uncharacterized protein n=1 Tax=Calycomorphotria hydatis TaxID=2528027 RepID=A0A517T566_9PLAN|nr:hypothetical protein [Calycomorphotria hydatis]QDT63517.1 hypothetical protein V22_07390 [Calycomorphotria hydatis]
MSSQSHDERLRVVKAAADTLRAAWAAEEAHRDSYIDEVERTFTEVENLFPGAGDCASNLFESAEGISVRAAEDILNDLLQTGPFPVEHELLDRLMAVVVKTSADQIGIIPSFPLQWHGYLQTPLNSACIGSTGGDGTHFSLIEVGGRITEDSPVVVTYPCDDQSYVVAESLYDFLCLGLHYGYFNYMDVFWDQSNASRTGWWFADDLEEDDRQLLKQLAEELNLKPLPPTAINRDALEEKYKGQIWYRSDWQVSS